MPTVTVNSTFDIEDLGKVQQKKERLNVLRSDVQKDKFDRYSESNKKYKPS